VSTGTEPEPFTRAECFPETLRHLIEVRGYARNRKAVAEAVYVSPSALSQYASGRSKPSFENLLGLARFFGVSLDYLVYGENSGPSSLPDPGPLARAVDHSLSKVQALSSRQMAYTTRIASILAQQIAESAKDLAAQGQTAHFTGQLDDDQTLVLEGYALTTRLLSMDLSYDVLNHSEAGHEAAGRFLGVVANNLARGRSVHILLPGEPQAIKQLADAERTLLGNICTNDSVSKYLQIRATTAPVFVGVCLYTLDTVGLSTEQPLLWESVSDSVSSVGEIAYVIPPSDVVLADTLLDHTHLARAGAAFDALWTKAKRI
jgi:transcriptional regulator with XRE-family HTH domain